MFTTLEDVQQYKQALDAACVPQLDRAIVLDWDHWQNQPPFLSKRKDEAPEGSYLYGIRIVWRVKVVTTTTRYQV